MHHNHAPSFKIVDDSCLQEHAEVDRMLGLESLMKSDLNKSVSQMSEIDCLCVAKSYIKRAQSMAGSTMYKELETLEDCRNELRDIILG
jgi:hypothetical protein